MHHRGRIHDAAVVAVSEGRDVALTHVLDDFQQVGLDVELGGFASFVGHTQGAKATGILFFATGQVVTTLLGISFATSFSFQEFVSEHPVAPAAVVIKQGQRTDGLVEDVQVSGVQQQTLSGNQGFTSHL